MVTVAWVQCPSLSFKRNTQVVCASQLVCSSLHLNTCNYNASIYMCMYPCIGNAFKFRFQYTVGVVQARDCIGDLQDIVGIFHSASSHNMPINQWTTFPLYWWLAERWCWYCSHGLRQFTRCTRHPERVTDSPLVAWECLGGESEPVNQVVGRARPGWAETWQGFEKSFVNIISSNSGYPIQLVLSLDLIRVTWSNVHSMSHHQMDKFSAKSL